MTMREQQEKEIATIKERTFKLRLSDEDVKRLWEKVGMVGMTAGELLTSFVGDLVDGTYSNGSDERMYAEQWFDRCGFAYEAEKTFLRYLLRNMEIDCFLEDIDTLEATKEEKADLEKKLEDKNYPWADIVLTSKEHPQGIKCYATREDWINEEKEQLAYLENEITYHQEQINETWNKFIQWTDNKNSNQEAEIKAVQEWQRAMKGE